MSDSFVELNRTFHSISVNSGDTDEFDSRRLGIGGGLSWSELLVEYRTVILSEAGTGKTEEMRHAARKLREEGKRAFFLRLEFVADEFEIAFEEGDIFEFEQWLASGEQAWLFLDSVDEARLRGPQDFERAIRKIAIRLTAALQRAHIVLTSRGSAWRPVTDLRLCEQHLKYTAVQVGDEASGEEGSGDTVFKIVAFDNLETKQIERFSRFRGVQDTKPFLDAIERSDAWSMVARPDDLAELVEYWKVNNRIGNRLELMQASIARRLAERDQNRAEASPLSADHASAGARSVAAVATMSQESKIRVPDGRQNAAGVDIAEILPAWDDKKCAALLARPIFDEAIYQTVRFHHREVREYLVAEWFKELLERQTSRRKIESLFFRRQYGLEVIAPTMRPVLVWLILLDKNTCERAIEIAPEIVLEGGEPKALPLTTRRKILHDVCESMDGSISGGSTADYRAIQRFADKDLSPDVKVLLAKYAGNHDLQWFLLRMVWQGELVEALPEAMDVALNPKAALYPRIAAIRAVLAVGKQSDKLELRSRFQNETSTLKRAWFEELLEELPPTKHSVDWVLACVRKLEPNDRYAIDHLPVGISAFIKPLNLDLLAALVNGLEALISKRPVVERRYCEISKRHGWLISSVVPALERIISAKHPAAVQMPALSILQKLPSTRHYHDWGLREPNTELSKLVPDWPELNDALFWHEVGNARRNRQKKRKERVTEFWQVSVFGESYWKFTPEDFDRVLIAVTERASRDDRLVALSLAFRLYVEAKRPRHWRDAMKRSVAKRPTLRAALHDHLHPPPLTDEQKKWRRENAEYERRRKRREAVSASREKVWKADLAAHISQIREHGLPEPSAISNRQWYLHEKMRELDTQHSHWTSGNWELLIPAFGEEIATAFRDCTTGYWRRYQPRLVSEGKPTERTSFKVIFGLTGLNIEARETENWQSTLSESEAEIAFRYAMAELNGFPDWMPSLLEAFPDRITALLLQEVDRDLRVEREKTDSHYILYDLSWSGSWAWTAIGRGVYERLSSREPKNISNLTYMLNVVQGAGISSQKLGLLARHRSMDRRHAHAAFWHAVWVGIEPDQAIDALALRLKSIRNPSKQTSFAMQFITRLLGSRRSPTKIGAAYLKPRHLKDLCTLMHVYVREEDDIQRVGKGVYSPGLRDDAQDARNQLIALLKDIPGKESYLALMELARLHPEPSARPWMQHHAKTKAAIDADLAPWSTEQTIEFQTVIERTPKNHRELFDLAEMRFLDLKDELEHGDSSIAAILKKGATLETEMRTYLGDWLRSRSLGRYSVPQEEELADSKRIDLRFHGSQFDAPVPVELKLADNWTGSKLFERMENQLCGDYLRDIRSSRGFFVLVYRGEKQAWEHPETGEALSFESLVAELQRFWAKIAEKFLGVDEIRVIGIALTARTKP